MVLVTGSLMTWLGHLSLGVFWIWFPLTLFVFIALTGILVFAPLRSKQVQLLQKDQIQSAAYVKVKNQSARLSALVTALVLVILALMVWKPEFKQLPGSICK